MTALPLHRVTQDARRLIADGREVEAAARLAAALQLHDAVASPPDPDLIDAAMTFAELADRVPVDQLSWARYAYQASVRAYGLDHDVTAAAADVLADVLTDQDLAVDAIVVLDALAGIYTRRNDVGNAVLTRRQLAELLQQEGRCEEAEQQISAAQAFWYPHRRDPVLRRWGAVLTIVHTVILAGCGRHDAALQLLHSRQKLLAGVGEAVRHGACVFGYYSIVLSGHDHAALCTRPPATWALTSDQLSAYTRLLGMDASIGPLRASWPPPFTQQ